MNQVKHMDHGTKLVAIIDKVLRGPVGRVIMITGKFGTFAWSISVEINLYLT